MTDRVRRWWRYPFAVAGPLAVAMYGAVALAGALSYVLVPRVWQIWPGAVVFISCFLALQRVRRRFMDRRGITPVVRTRPRRARTAILLLNAVAGVTIAIGVTAALGPAWVWPCVAAVLLAWECWRRRKLPSDEDADPRWARHWSPETHPAHEFRAMPEMQAGRYEEALSLLRQALEMKPGKQAILYNLACAEARTGQTEAALDHLVAATESNQRLLRSAQTDADLASIRDDPRFPR